MSLLASEYLKTQETWNKEVHSNPCMLRNVPDILKTQEMCIKAAEEDPWQLKYVPDHFKTQERCDKAAKDDRSYLKYVSNWFVTREGYACGMMTVNIGLMMKIIFLSGTIGVKNERLKKLQ